MLAEWLKQGRRRRQEGDRRPTATHAVGLAVRRCARPPLRRRRRTWRRCSWSGTLAMVLLGIAGRLLDFNVPGTDAYAGYCMAARGLPRARAHAEARRAHPRHADPRARSRGRARRALELWALAAATLLAGAVRVLQRAARVAVVRLQRHLHRQRRDAAVDSAARRWRSARSCSLIALVDELVLEWRGARRAVAPAEALHHE